MLAREPRGFQRLHQVAALRFDLDEQRNVVEEDKRVRKLRPFPFPARVSADEVTEE